MGGAVKLPKYSMKSPRYLLGAAILVSCFQLAEAATLRYRQSGDWSEIYTGSGNGWANNDGSQSGAVPGAGDEARINFGNNTVTVSTTVPTLNIVKIGVDESGNMVVTNGGELTTTADILAGNNNANATGSLTVRDGGTVNVGNILWAANQLSNGAIQIDSGGVVNVASHLWWGVTGAATISIGGTLNQTGDGILGLGTNNAADPTGGSAQVGILSGGILNLNNISGDAGTPSIHTGSQIQIDPGGLLTVKGDKVGTLNQYITASEIVPTSGTIEVLFDAQSNLTRVTVIPEPSAGLLLGIFSLGVAARRRRA